jgi:hypothetical protein
MIVKLTLEPLGFTGKTKVPRPSWDHINPGKGAPSHRIEAAVDVRHSSYTLGGGRRVNDLTRNGFRRKVCFKDNTDDEKQNAHFH